MKTLSMAFTTLAALALASCGSSNSTSSGAPTCTPAPFTAADPTGAEAYCVAFYDALCARAYRDCVTELGGLRGMYPDEATCRTAEGSLCASRDFSTTAVNAGCGGACISLIQTSACSLFTGPEPTACVAASGSVPPPCTATITPGTLSDTIGTGDPIYDGGHSKTYCISLTAGQSVTISTAAPVSGLAIGDTVLHLLDAAGTQVSTDDDSGTGFYSLISAYPVTATGVYKIVVRGWSPSVVGAYQLTVSVL